LARLNLSTARQKRDSVLRNLNWYLGEPTDIDQAIIDAEVAIAEANLLEAERQWERLKDGPNRDDIAAAEARIEAAQANINLARITAPFSGTVSEIKIKPGDQVAPGTPVIQLADLTALMVDVDISEIDINDIEVGQRASLTFDAVMDRQYAGEVVEVGLVGRNVQGIVNFSVVVRLLNPDDAIHPGLTAAVSIVTNQIEDALRVPNRAVRVRNGERVVYVLREGTPEMTPVELGASSELYSEVLSGDIREGDRIVLNPPAEFESDGRPPFAR
jgi:HlyD family secretion protein